MAVGYTSSSSGHRSQIQVTKGLNRMRLFSARRRLIHCINNYTYTARVTQVAASDSESVGPLGSNEVAAAPPWFCVCESSRSRRGVVGRWVDGTTDSSNTLHRIPVAVQRRGDGVVDCLASIPQHDCRAVQLKQGKLMPAYLLWSLFHRPF